MKAKDKVTASLPESRKVVGAVDQSRRSFAKVGAAAVPVMMTLANRSVWAGTNACMSHTAFMSYAANPAASHIVVQEVSAWKSPDEWRGDTAALDAVISVIAPGKTNASPINEVWPGVETGTLAVVDALASSDATAYRIASRLNNYVQPATILDTLISNDNFDEYAAFYGSVCITGAV